MSSEKLKIEYIPISEIVPYSKNPRKNEKAVEIVSKSISTYGFKVPIILDKDNIIIAGHTRLQAAKKLGLQEVPIIRADELSEKQIKAFRIMENKSQEYSDWDEDKLIEELTDLEKMDEDILDLTGFNFDELNYLLDIKNLQTETIFAEGAEDKIELENKHNIKEGDIVVIDEKHKIICGDSSDPEVIHKLCGDNKIDLIITSPPYNLNISYGKYSDNKELKDYLRMIEQVFLNLKDFMNKGRFACINIGREWGPINLPAEYDQLMKANDYVFFRNIYWSKPTGSARATITNRNPFPRYYIPKVSTELIQIYSNEEEPKVFDSMITYKFGEELSDKKRREEKIPKILLSKYSGNVWEMHTETQLSGKHPAPFPTQLPFNCIRFFSFQDEKVIDPFLGSGTSLIAADQLNRIGLGIDIDPAYVSIAIERYKLYKPGAKIRIEKNNAPEGPKTSQNEDK